MFKKVLKNASWIIVCQIVQTILSFIVGMISARYLGPANYGILNYASSIIVFVTPIMQLGLRGTLVNEIVSYPESENKTLGTALAMCLISAVFCILGIIGFALVFDSGDKITQAICSIYSICLIFQALEMSRFWFQAKLLSKYTSIISLIAYSIVSSYKIYLLICQKSVYWFALSYAIDSFVISVAMLFFYKKITGKKLVFSFSRCREMLSKSKYYIVSGMMVTVFSISDKIMLKNMLGAEATGFYSAAITCAGVTGFVYVAIIDSIRPVILSAKKEENNEYGNIISGLFSLIFYVSIMQCVVTTVFAEPIIKVLYGQKYSPAINVLRIINWQITYSYFGTIRNIWLLAEEKQKYLWIINLGGATINIILNLILIPIFGILGAAVTAFVTQFSINFIFCFIVKELREAGILMLKGMNPKFAWNSFRKVVKELKVT